MSFNSFTATETSYDMACDMNKKFRVGDEFYTSPNQTSLPDPLPIRVPLSSSPSPPELRRQIWATDGYPYLAFLPEWPFFDMWSRFATPVDQIAISRNRDGYFLPVEVQQQWRTFDICIREISHALSKHLTITFRELTGLWVIPPNPRLSGYLNLHHTEIDTRNSISQSIDAFIIQGAYVVFLLELCRSYPSTSGHVTQRSFEDICGTANIHSDWINELSLSKVMAASGAIQQRGCLIEVRLCKWLNLVPYMIKRGIPIWFFWDYSLMPQLGRESWLSSYMPYSDQTSQKFMSNDVDFAFPCVHDGSGQLPGETMRAFFERRRETRMQVRINESPQFREVRMQRVRSQARKISPGADGPLVYYWQKEGPYEIRMRRALTHTLAENWWPLWEENCKVYDSFSNQWDCCSEWSFVADDDSDVNKNVQQSGDCEPSTDLTSSEAHSMFPKEVTNFPPLTEEGNHYVFSSAQSDNASSPRVADKNTSRSQASRSRKAVSGNRGKPVNSKLEIDEAALGAGRKTGSLQATPVAQDDKLSQSEPQFLEDLLYYRYGYCMQETPYTGLPQAMKDNVVPAFHNWTTICRTIGGNSLSFTTKDQDQVRDFLSVVTCSERPFHDVPGKYWDLSSANKEFLGDAHNTKIRIIIKEFRNGTMCLLYPRNSATTEKSWYVAVDAVTSLECIRRALGPSPTNIVDFLVERGKSFHTLFPLLALNFQIPRVPPNLRKSTRVLGRRSVDYKFSTADFVEYEYLRDSFFKKNQAAARRALCYGGIISRLAREAVPNSTIYMGPSDSALRAEQEVFSDGKVLFVDDKLSEDALDLICGTYQVETGQSGQVAIKSWFPRHNTWEKSGYNVGFWSEECEQFYLDRRSTILSGNCTTLFNGSEWRNKTRSTGGKNLKLSSKMEDAAIAFLRSSQGDHLTGGGHGRI